MEVCKGVWEEVDLMVQNLVAVYSFINSESIGHTYRVDLLYSSEQCTGLFLLVKGTQLIW
jgi:hypothetical protein